MEQNATEELPTRFSNVTPRRRGRKSSGPLYSAGGTATQSYVPFDPFVYAPPPSRGSPARPFSLEADDADVLGPGGTQVLEGATQQLYDDDDDDDQPVGATQQLDAMSPWGVTQPLPTQELYDDDDDDENSQWPTGSQATHLPPATPAWLAAAAADVAPLSGSSAANRRAAAAKRSPRSPGGSPTQVKMDALSIQMADGSKPVPPRRRPRPSGPRDAPPPPPAAPPPPSPRAEAMAQKHKEQQEEIDALRAELAQRLHKKDEEMEELKRELERMKVSAPPLPPPPPPPLAEAPPLTEEEVEAEVEGLCRIEPEVVDDDDATEAASEGEWSDGSDDDEAAAAARAAYADAVAAARAEVEATGGEAQPAENDVGVAFGPVIRMGTPAAEDDDDEVVVIEEEAAAPSPPLPPPSTGRWRKSHDGRAASRRVLGTLTPEEATVALPPTPSPARPARNRLLPHEVAAAAEAAQVKAAFTPGSFERMSRGGRKRGGGGFVPSRRRSLLAPKRRPAAGAPVVGFSGVSAAEKQTMCQVVAALGGVVAYGNADAPCTHLVVGRRGAAGRPKRTLKVLHAVLGGAWVVDPKWVLQSLDHGGFLAEEPYEMAAEFPAARRARELRAAEGEEGEEEAAAETLAPLHGLSIFVAPNGDGEQRDTLRALATAAGAKVAATLRGADMCVALPGARVAASRRGRAAPVVAPAWLYESVAALRPCPVEGFPAA